MKNIIAVLLLLTTFAVNAQKTEIFAPSGIALNGYDVVAFHTQNSSVKGVDSFTTEWKGVKWLFVSKQNLNSFQKEPEKYEPQYGGYCAYGASRGYKAPTEVNTWAVINNKLYFNYNLKVKDIWNQNRPAYIDSANAKWPAFKSN